MMRSLFSGISGLKSHQLKMDVISNNIANVNTAGFKRSRITFSDLFYQTIKHASAPQDNKGGTNPIEVGHGVKVASIDQIFTQGSFENTGKNSDVAIDGDGFFVLDDGQSRKYTRTGNFSIDSDGFFVHTTTGMKVLGWQAKKVPETGEAYIDTNRSLEYINFLPGEKLPAKATTYMEYRSNLNAIADSREFPEEITLEYGNPLDKKKLTIRFEKLDEVTWTFSVRDDNGELVDLDSATAGIQAQGRVLLWDDGTIKDVRLEDGTSLNSITITGQDADNDGNDDIFNIVRTPSSPPKVNYWTFEDLGGTEHKMWIKFKQSETNPNEYEWRVYDNNNHLIDLDGNNSIAYDEDFGIVTFDDNGMITNFTGPGGATNFTFDGLTINIDIDPSNRQLNFTEQNSGEFRGIPIGSDSIEFQFSASPDDKLKFDRINGATHSTSLAVYDSKGEAHELIMTFEKIDDKLWRYKASLSDDDPIIQKYLEMHPEAKEGDELTDAEREAIMNNIFLDPEFGDTRSGFLVFNDLGRLDIDKTRSVNGAQYPDFVNKLIFHPDNANPVSIDLDFKAVTQYEYDFTTAARQQNGYPMGMLETYTIDEEGVIRGIYSNGYKQPIGQIATVTFYNPSGLHKSGDTLWAPTANSGNPIISKTGANKGTKLQTGVLEMSNVDLAQEFTDMIIAQRGFQANSKSITTSDQMLQELVNLKR